VSVVEEGARVTEAKGLGRWLARRAPLSARGTVTVAIVSDAAVRRLNRRFRGVDEATDVLAFPEKGSAFFAEGGRKRRPAPFLGEIVIARGAARKQAKTLGHSLGTELRVLALHGLLHLLGYDHEADNGRMARAEARLRRKAGLPPGLIARSS
jgi:probable rRNA maturation factor